MLKEIGSNFWLQQGEKKRSEINKRIFNVDFDDFVFTSSGRNAIALILAELNDNERRALLPSFTCESVIEPFFKQGYRVDFYSVFNGLGVDINQFFEDVRVSKPSVLLIHNYYGFNTTSEIKGLITDLKNQGIVVIEDITQTLYSSYSRLCADYYVGSFRKWGGIPDGGFALKTVGRFFSKPDEEDVRLVDSKVNAMKAKFNYLFNNTGNKDDFLRMYLEAEKILENEHQLYRMSDVAMIEQANLDIISLVRIRRDNYRFLLSNLLGSRLKPLFESLPDNVAPLYFPILCDGKRSALQGWLRSNQIFAPIVWPRPDCFTGSIGEAENFYNDLLCIPCDQRYGINEMEYIVNCLRIFIDNWEGMATV